MTKENKTYNIYYCSDSNGLQLLKQSIYSIEKNCTNNYIIHCLTSCLTQEEVESLKAYFMILSKVRVIVYDCSDILNDCFNDYEDIAYLKHISKTTMLRMYVNKIIDLTDIDKILYLDNDTYINKDLGELFETNLDGYCLGAVRDTFVCWTKHFPHKRDEFYLNRRRKSNYFNGGVELLNVQEILKNDMFSELQNFELKPYMKLTDQDIYNIVFENKVKFLDLKYNCKWWMNFNKNDIVIIHAAGHKRQLKYLILIDYDIYGGNKNYKSFQYYYDMNNKANIKMLEKEKDRVYNIYYCCDKDNLDLMILSIKSLIKKCNKECKYIIHCLTCDLYSYDIDKLMSLTTDNIIINNYDCSEISSMLNSYYDTCEDKISLLKLYVNKILDLSNIDRLLYLRCDTFINKDLEYIFETDIDDNYIAASRDIKILWSESNKNEYYNKYIEKSNYFNGGVELLNVKKMIEDKKFDELQAFKFDDDEFVFTDTDIYNEILGDKVTYFDLYFNYKWWIKEWNFDYIYIMNFEGCKSYKKPIYLSYLLNGDLELPHKYKVNMITKEFEYYYRLNFKLE